MEKTAKQKNSGLIRTAKNIIFELRLLPPQGFGRDGQNPRRHTRIPRVQGIEFRCVEKKSRFWRKWFAKDCPKSSQRIAESSLGVNEDLNKQAKNAGNGVFTTRFASAEGKSSVLIALQIIRLKSKLWKQASLIEVFEEQTRTNLYIVHRCL